MFDLSIYTITYNRPDLLFRLYESISKLNCKDSSVEWVIINNGSSQSTKELIEKFNLTNGIHLSVYSIESNIGFTRADNFFYDNHQAGKYVVRIDDDDIALPSLVAAFEECKIEADLDDRVCGMLFNMADIIQGRVIGPEFPCNKFRTTNYNLFYRNGVTGDKVHVYKTSVRSKYKHVIFPGELLTPTSIVYNQMDSKYLHLCFNRTVALREYTLSGITLSKSHLLNTVGNIVNFQYLLKHQNSFFRDRLVFSIKIANQIVRSKYNTSFLLCSKELSSGVKATVLALAPIKFFYALHIKASLFMKEFI
jgi:glycosyltransferase involved in cell wall biosynthesis